MSYTYTCADCGLLKTLKAKPIRPHSGKCSSCSKKFKYSDTKICTACKTPKPLENFYTRPNGQPFPECSKCNSNRSLRFQTVHSEKTKTYKSSPRYLEKAYKRNKERRERFPEIARNYQMKSHYGITWDEYQKILLNQNGVCAVCGNTETRYIKGKLCRLSVDHDHSCCSGYKSCGKCIRGLLCSKCNTALGLLEDDPKVISTLHEYVNKQNRGHC